MKRSILMLLVMSAALIFFGCEKMDPLSESGNDLDTASLKAAKVRSPFTGICYPAPKDPIEGGTIKLLPNGQTHHMGYAAEWYDEASDYRVSGPSIWDANYFWAGEPFASDAKVWGKTKIYVDDPNEEDPNAPHIGLWEMTWHGYLTFDPDGPVLAGYVNVVGTGKEGVVKGLTAIWKYSIDWNFIGPPMYVTEGYIK